MLKRAPRCKKGPPKIITAQPVHTENEITKQKERHLSKFLGPTIPSSGLI
jgi:hypothetical protein